VDLEGAGIRFVPWRSATRSWNPIADVRALAELAGILARGRYDIVHTHNAKPGVIGRPTARALGVPCVVNTVHGFDARPDDSLLKRSAFMGLEWFAAQFSHQELYQGVEDRRRARRLGMLRKGKGVFIGNGTDLAAFDPVLVSSEALIRLRRDFGFSDETLVVGTIGRLVGEKGYRELFAAARRVRERAPHVRFLAVGQEDPSKADRITHQEMRRAGPDVLFAGWRDDVRDLIALMDVFLLPSWREGVPRSAIEAAAMGKAMVLSDIPGCRQVARDEHEALLTPPRDDEALGAAIFRLVLDPDLRQRLGTAARSRALVRFDERRVIGAILEEYERVLSKWPARRAA
jgi:glycosyltransferase involved in cell wall biosynthesis